MDYRVVIPTYKRSTTLKEKTLNYLLKTDIDFSNVDIFLSDKNERQEYKNILTGYEYKKLNLIDGKLGVGKNRNYIVDYYPPAQKIVSIDDDIKGLNYKIDDKTRIEIIDLDNCIKTNFEKTINANFNLWGIYPVNNPYFMKHAISFDLKYIAAGFYGWINSHEEKAYCSLEDKEDFERSITYYLSDNGVVRFNYISMNTNGYQGQGGMQVTRTKQRIKESAEFLVKKYPRLCTLFVSKQGQYEVRLKDKRQVKI